MTDVAVSDGGALAPAEGAPIDTNAPEPNSPLGSQVPQREEAKPEPAKSARDAIRNAAEQVKAKEAAKDQAPKVEAKTEPKPEGKTEPKAETKPEAKQETRAEQPRENGRFVSANPEAKPAQQATETPVHHREAPARFSPDAKAEWQAVPDKVKAEVHRATRELEQGLIKYRGDAEKYETVRQYDEMARKNGGDLSKSLARVVDIEDTFSRDPIEGFRKIAHHFGISLEQVAAHVLNQPYDQRAAGQDSEVASLKSEIAQLKETITSLQPVVQEYKQSSDERALAEWAADKPYFAQLRPEVSALVAQGYGPDEAYQAAVYQFQEKAAAFGFVPQPPASSAPAPQQPKPLNPAGQKSISGAPANGSDPSTRKGPAPSIKDAIKRASARAA